MIDFASLVLGPAMAVFGQPVTVTPTKSRPSAPAYPARGVFASKSVQEQIQGTDLFQQTFQPELGINLGDFSVPPAQGDTVLMPQGTFTITNVIIDGQGGATLILRQP